MSVLALLAVLAWAVIRPRGWPEAVAAGPAAVIVIAVGAISARDAGAEARRLGPVIGFLIAILVLAHLCDDDGLFRACGARLEIQGSTERAVVAASAQADLLVVARDGDRARLGPKSLGKETRFVVDHAACPVLLVWPEAAPDVDTIPPPPRHTPHGGQ